MKKWLFNPFIYIAGEKALIIGWSVMLLTAFICSFSNTHFDGAIDVHSGHATSGIVYFIEPVIDWASLTISLYLFGRFFSQSAVRLIDIAGTIALARWPLIFFSFIGFGIKPIKQLPITSDPAQILKSIDGLTIALSLFGLVFVIWFIALLYNAFSVSANLKGSKSAWVFIAGLIVAEVISQVALHYTYSLLT